MNTGNAKVGEFQIGAIYDDIKRSYILCSWQTTHSTWKYIGNGKFLNCNCSSIYEPDTDNLVESEMTPEKFDRISGSIADDITKFQSSLKYTGN